MKNEEESVELFLMKMENDGRTDYVSPRPAKIQFQKKFLWEAFIQINAVIICEEMPLFTQSHIKRIWSEIFPLVTILVDAHRKYAKQRVTGLAIN